MKQIIGEERFAYLDRWQNLVPCWLRYVSSTDMSRLLRQYQHHTDVNWSSQRRILFILDGCPSIVDTLAWNYYIHYYLDPKFDPAIENKKSLKNLHANFPFTKNIFNDPEFVYGAIQKVLYGSFKNLRDESSFVKHEAKYSRIRNDHNKFHLCHSACRILLIFKQINIKNKTHHYYEIVSILTSMMKYPFLRAIGIDLWSEIMKENHDPMNDEIRSELALPMAALCAPLKG